MSTDPFSIVNDWLTFQKKYWETFSSLNPNDTSPKEFPQQSFDFIKNPWSDALDSWWKNASPTATPSVQDFFTQLIDQSKSYFQMAEQMNSAFQAASTVNQSVSQWQEAITGMLTGMKETFSVSPDAQKSLHNWMGIGGMPLDHWQRMASTLSFMPGDFFQDINTLDPLHMKDAIQGHLDRFISAPAVGHMRERQFLYQELYRLGNNYQTALQASLQFQNKMGLKSIERFQSCFKNMEEKGLQLESMRSVYDLWVDCCEEVYAESVTTDEYVEIHGNLINALMALKQHTRLLVDEVLESFNMPTRRELNALHDRSHEQWRENKKLRNELAALKEQVAAISKPEPAVKSKTPARTPPAAPVPKRTEKATRPADRK
ncbi:putative Poly(3-hydroxyalkanoate) polymerase subunit PhaE [Candidatus Methylobacter favarea]|uniref:Poly(3-hydroxyalkanoate) polymerase subunit PhaE n=1 Tax=Candidatus Methylobacter favarea TaxID=2707345 RepID=A0A8S0WJE7_9GAMM|nr:class III poly(R)-hydroxyalkanoic acid synthase subunit PhaE [Candidatus Methylobacter favarea]CAA9891264.1 putative Poly(3-hydroxyalkanoate) polymerase subunit PhaE [Candidatus Methylobacter favarea]